MGPFARVMLAAAVGAASPAVAAAQAAGDSAPAGSAEPPAKAVVPATGYSYRGPTPPLAERAHARAPARADAPASSGPDAQMPGFETLASGGTRLFVALSKAVDFDQRAPGAARARRLVRRGPEGQRAADGQPRPGEGRSRAAERRVPQGRLPSGRSRAGRVPADRRERHRRRRRAARRAVGRAVGRASG